MNFTKSKFVFFNFSAAIFATAVAPFSFRCLQFINSVPSKVVCNKGR